MAEVTARQNPFRSERLHALAFRFRDAAGAAGFDELVARICAPGFRGAIVGGKGTGKTTLCLELDRALTARGRAVTHVRLSSEPGARFPFAELPRLPDVVIVDGAEQLSRWGWARLRWHTRRAGGLLVTTHAPGRLATVLTTASSPALLRELLDDLVGRALPPELLAGLYQRHDGNLRAVLRALYDRAADNALPVELPTR